MGERTRPSQASALPAVSAEAALSFLKDTKGALTWPAKELAETLKIGRREGDSKWATAGVNGNPTLPLVDRKSAPQPN